mmetsp:Transcript_33644/g.84352  ORF Transcript_33644/g.84352 Transcript_33644/m.84352 type:complete len:257 (-) Transcript_33644:440-1210(-)
MERWRPCASPSPRTRTPRAWARSSSSTPPPLTLGRPRRRCTGGALAARPWRRSTSRRPTTAPGFCSSRERWNARDSRRCAPIAASPPTCWETCREVIDGHALQYRCLQMHSSYMYVSMRAAIVSPAGFAGSTCRAVLVGNQGWCARTSQLFLPPGRRAARLPVHLLVGTLCVERQLHLLRGRVEGLQVVVLPGLPRHHLHHHLPEVHALPVLALRHLLRVRQLPPKALQRHLAHLEQHSLHLGPGESADQHHVARP